MDILSDVLKKIKLSSAVYFKSDFSAPWGMDIPKGPFAQFHIVTRGQCTLRVQQQVIQLFAGDIIVFPFGNNHLLSDAPTSTLRSGKEVVESIMCGNSVFGGESVATTLVCGHFEFDRSIEHPFIQELPELIHITDADKKQLPWLESIMNLVMQEASSNAAGSYAVVDKLAEILFVHVLRAYILNSNTPKGFVAALHDERINKVIKAIHESPEDDWQLVDMARIAGMSRTGFSNQFKKLIGDTPMNYITQWRIVHAKELLKTSTKTVGEIAEQVGYKSEAAFNRVFKKKVAHTPLKYRQVALKSA